MMLSMYRFLHSTGSRQTIVTGFRQTTVFVGFLGARAHAAEWEFLSQ